jgi:hypothetical protein
MGKDITGLGCMVTKKTLENAGGTSEIVLTHHLNKSWNLGYAPGFGTNCVDGDADCVGLSSGGLWMDDKC